MKNILINNKNTEKRKWVGLGWLKSDGTEREGKRGGGIYGDANAGSG